MSFVKGKAKMPFRAIESKEKGDRSKTNQWRIWRTWSTV